MSTSTDWDVEFEARIVMQPQDSSPSQQYVVTPGTLAALALLCTNGTVQP